MNHQASPPAEWSMTDQEFDQLRRAIFDFSGIVIGPVIAAMFMAVWGIFSPSASDTPAPPA